MRQVDGWIGRNFESRLGLIALLHRLRLDYHKPNVTRGQSSTKKFSN
jgi:hypothetical protein